MRYLIKYTPFGEYYFGNEKRFSYAKSAENATYFIRGENVPLQTTLFGALRFLILPEKNYSYAKEHPELIGEAPFDIESESIQSFGAIKSMSPVFICKDNEWFVPTPFDHNVAIEDKYTPYDSYSEICTVEGQKLYTEQYNSKFGIEESYMSLKDCHLERDLFISNVQVGINRKNSKEGFFKKEYKLLKDGYSFAIVAEVDDGVSIKNQSVLLGQGKSPFSVDVSPYKDKDLCEKVKDTLSKARADVGLNDENYVYFLSDYYTDSKLDELRSNFDFAVIQSRDYRSFTIFDSSKVKRGECLHRFIKSGSIALCSQINSLDNQSTAQCNANTIGFNNIIIG